MGDPVYMTWLLGSVWKPRTWYRKNCRAAWGGGVGDGAGWGAGEWVGQENWGDENTGCVGGVGQGEALQEGKGGEPPAASRGGQPNNAHLVQPAVAAAGHRL